MPNRNNVFIFRKIDGLLTVQAGQSGSLVIRQVNLEITDSSVIIVYFSWFAVFFALIHTIKYYCT